LYGAVNSLFPGLESDFFRNRLTHSLEVAQIAKSIAIRLNHNLDKEKSDFYIEQDIVEFAGLAHDLGHPPFGHLGEEALDELMMQYGGFEGNAQTLRILTRLEKRVRGDETNPFKYQNDCRLGLNLASRTLASIIKYDLEIPLSKTERTTLKADQKIAKISPIKGFYKSESKIVERIKKDLGYSSKVDPRKFRTIECDIMDIADDIAYSTYDLEDSLKAGFIKPIDLLCAPDSIINEVAKGASEGT